MLGYYPPNTWCYVNYAASWKWDILCFYFPMAVIALVGTGYMSMVIWKIWMVNCASEKDMHRCGPAGSELRG